MNISLAQVLAILPVLSVFVVLFFERKNPASSIAWILVLIFLPYVGFLAYLFFGTGFHMNKRKKYAIKAAVDDFLFKQSGQQLRLGEGYRFMESKGNFARMVHYLHQVGRGVYSQNNDATVYTNGNEKFAALLADMQAAKKHIHLLYYIFRDDDLGRKILEVAKEKAAAGVEVKILYDSVGSLLMPTRRFKEIQKFGGEVSSFSPLRFSFLSQLRVNYRNHRKIAVIDGTIGYVGGMNVGDEYLGKNKKLTPWRDTHMRIVGAAVWFLQERFLMDWVHATGAKLPETNIAQYYSEPIKAGSLGIQIVSSGPDVESSPIRGGVLEMLYSAQNNIYLQTPYFTPDDAFLDALKAAAQSGIDVRLMLPLYKDHVIVQWATLNYAREVLDAGVHVYLYKGFLHGKTIVCDGAVATIGTCNIGNRSFYLNFEVNAFVYNDEFAKQQEQTFLQDIENCIPIDAKWFTKQHKVKLALYRASRLLAPLM